MLTSLRSRRAGTPPRGLPIMASVVAGVSGGRRFRYGGGGVSASWLSLRGDGQHYCGLWYSRRRREDRGRGQTGLGAPVERQPQQRVSGGDRSPARGEQEDGYAPRARAGGGARAQGSGGDPEQLACDRGGQRVFAERGLRREAARGDALPHRPGLHRPRRGPAAQQARDERRRRDRRDPEGRRPT